MSWRRLSAKCRVLASNRTDYEEDGGWAIAITGGGLFQGEGVVARLSIQSRRECAVAIKHDA
jgi:hypothetical protein